MPIRRSFMVLLGALVLTAPSLATGNEERSERPRRGDASESRIQERRETRGRSEAGEQRTSRAWRNPETSFEINRRLSPQGNQRERDDDGVARRRFQDLEHSRPELTGKRNVVRVWTRETGREIDRRDHDRDDRRPDRHDDGRIDRRPYHVVQREHGPISPSEWQAHRQSRIDERRGDGPSIDPRSPRRRDDRFDRNHDYFDGRIYRDYDRNQPESYDFRYRSRSPIGPAEIGRGYVLQYDTRTHQHYPGCGHYQYDGGWHRYPREHSHYDGCGHYFYDNSWHRWPRDHRHYAGCGHYYDDGDWFDFPRSHEHGPHCGHYRYDGIWHLFPKDHSHGPNCGHHYYGGDWHFWSRSHRHHPGCGHYYFNSLWFPFAPSYYGYQETVTVYGGSGGYDYDNNIVDAYDGAAQTHAERAYEKSRNGDPYGAIAAFSTAIASTPDNGPLYLAQGLTYMQVGDVRSAHSRIQEGLRRTPNLETGHPDLRGLIPDPEVIRWHTGELIRTIEADPANHRALFVLGYVHFLRGEYEEAKAALQDVAALDASNDSARRLLEFIYQNEAGPAPPDA